ncbi:MAG: hypothetical protein HOV67_01225 [Kribbellaceae bacterium]|nr:hypothetical protein [Kribbellaceae bacterium]
MSTDRSLRQVALAHGLVGFATCLCLIVFYAGAGVFGPINDIGNAVLVASPGSTWRGCGRAPGSGWSACG